MKLKFFALLISLFTWVSSTAQIEKLWEAYYTPSNDTLDIQGTKADAAGNLYTYGSVGRNLFFQKVNAQGTIEWTITENALLSQIPGNWTTHDSLLQWAKVTDITPLQNQDFDVVVTGKAKYVNNSGLYCFIMKFNSSGDTVWSRIYDNPALSARGWMRGASNPKILYAHNSLFLSTLAIVYAADSGIGNNDILLSRLDVDNGDILKHKNFSSQPVEGEFIENFTFKNNFLYVSGIYSIGRNEGQTFGGWESFLIKLDTAFNRVTEVFEGEPSSLNYAIQYEVSKDGDIHLLIQNQDSLKAYQKTILFIKYNDAGTELWRFQYNDTVNSNDSAFYFNIDNEKNIRIIGQTTHHNRSLFLLLDSDGNLKSLQKRDSISILINPPVNISSVAICFACPRIKTATTFPIINLENSAYYFSKKNQSSGISKEYNNSQHWWDVDTTWVSDYAPISLIFADTFEFVATALIDTLSSKKIRYIKYKDTSWLKVPFNLAATALSMNEIRLEWNSLTDYKTGLVIERSTDNNLFSIVDTVSISEHTCPPISE